MKFLLSRHNAAGTANGTSTGGGHTGVRSMIIGAPTATIAGFFFLTLQTLTQWHEGSSGGFGVAKAVVANRKVSSVVKVFIKLSLSFYVHGNLNKVAK
jgi:hypothetical protein